MVNQNVEPSLRAFNADAPPISSLRPFADRQPQAGAAVTAAADRHLGEALEQASLRVCRHADAGVATATETGRSSQENS